jgi:hypothetical protein
MTIIIYIGLEKKEGYTNAYYQKIVESMVTGRISNQF